MKSAVGHDAERSRKMNNMNPIQNIQKKRRLKYGTFAVAMTVSVIALVVVINAIFTALAYKNAWYFDMTERDLYTPDGNAMALLEEYRGSEELKIEFIFCMPEDRLKDNELCHMVNNLVRAYEEEFDFISVRYVDINKNPQIVDQYLATSTAKPKTTSVIVTNGTNAIVYAVDSFFVSDDGSADTIYALNGDYKIVSAIMRLSGDNPIAYFVTNHGEQVNGSALRELFVDAGYDVRDIDLSAEDFDPAAKVVVINNPQSDFWGADQEVNEIKKLDTLLDGSAGLMVFVDETANEMPILEDFLSHWGVVFERQSVRDYESSLPGTEGAKLIANYVTTGTGASLTASLRERNSIPKAIVTNARPITLLYDDEVGKYFSGNSATRYASKILTTSKDAVASPLEEGGETTKGIMNLLTVTVQSRYKDNVQHNSFLLAGGTAAFSDSAYINGTSYANRDIIFNVMKQFSKKNVPLDVNVKVFTDDALVLSAAEANQWTAICTVFLPVIVAGVGIFVYTRRRYL